MYENCLLQKCWSKHGKNTPAWKVIFVDYHTSEKLSKATGVIIIQSITTIIYKFLCYSPKYYITLRKLYISRYEVIGILSHSGSTVNKILSSWFISDESQIGPQGSHSVIQ